MEIRTDDELHQVNGVWLGPAGVTMPFRARYVAWLIGSVAWLLIFALERLWWPFGFWPLVWSLVGAVGVTKLLSKKITHQRPLIQVLLMFIQELRTPRRATTIVGGAANGSTVRITAQRPLPAPRSNRTSSAARTVVKEKPHA